MIVIELPGSGKESEGDFASLRKSELARFVGRAKRLAGIRGEVSVLLTDDVRLKQLNRDFRGKNKATDVLSFPAAVNGEGAAGDLAISVEIAVRQAVEQGHSLEDELRILLLHGLMHLAGFDHETDRGEMRARETELRGQLKLPLGLIERTQPTRKSGVRTKPLSRKVIQDSEPKTKRTSVG